MCHSTQQKTWHSHRSILAPGERHEAHKGNGAHPRFTWRDLFNHGELLWRFNGPQRHDKPTTHFELFNQRRRDMPKCGRDDYCVERTAFQPSVITVADLDAHIVVAEVSQHLCGGFGQWRGKFKKTKPPPPKPPYFGSGNTNAAHHQNPVGAAAPARHEAPVK